MSERKERILLSRYPPDAPHNKTFMRGSSYHNGKSILLSDDRKDAFWFSKKIVG